MSSSFKLKNNAVGTLIANITSSQTSITLVSGQGGNFPTLGLNEYCPATLIKADGTVEIVKVTARTGDVLTIARGQEGTAAASFLAGDRVELRMTAGAFEEMQDKITRPHTTAIFEKITINTTAAAGIVDFDASTQAVEFSNANASSNWTLNIRGSETVTLDSLMNIGESLSLTHMVKQGTTAYYNNAVTVDGASVTPVWQGIAPSNGNASSIDIYSYVIIKTAAATFTVLAAQAKFA